ncbi:hypothetical protein NDU88_006674 [Pleurodeles waltl]|uniref:Uncharacterized protein n=1 Tax=Pleurodeles waltl TaxID=8319 RepID=A0AAV7UQP3_PLEWA|nr:hypothetical protein NDU88_006674 [Pleurodeles waltl]
MGGARGTPFTALFNHLPDSVSALGSPSVMRRSLMNSPTAPVHRDEGRIASPLASSASAMLQSLRVVEPIPHINPPPWPMPQGKEKEKKKVGPHGPPLRQRGEELLVFPRHPLLLNIRSERGALPELLPRVLGLSLQAPEEQGERTHLQSQRPPSCVRGPRPEEVTCGRLSRSGPRGREVLLATAGESAPPRSGLRLPPGSGPRAAIQQQLRWPCTVLIRGPGGRSSLTSRTPSCGAKPRPHPLHI